MDCPFLRGGFLGCHYCAAGGKQKDVKDSDYVESYCKGLYPHCELYKRSK